MRKPLAKTTFVLVTRSFIYTTKRKDWVKQARAPAPCPPPASFSIIRGGGAGVFENLTGRRIVSGHVSGKIYPGIWAEFYIREHGRFGLPGHPGRSVYPGSTGQPAAASGQIYHPGRGYPTTLKSRKSEKIAGLTMRPPQYMLLKDFCSLGSSRGPPPGEEGHVARGTKSKSHPSLTVVV